MSLKLLSQSILYNVRNLLQEPEELFELLGVRDTDRILQIGCSSIYYTRALAHMARDGKVYIIDTCSRDLERVTAKSGNGHNIVTICCSSEALLLPRLTFDKVFCLNGLPDLIDAARAVAVWCDLLKTRGKFFLRATSHLTPCAVQEFSEDSLYHVGTMKGVDVFVKDWAHHSNDTEQPAEVYCDVFLPDALFAMAR